MAPSNQICLDLTGICDAARQNLSAAARVGDALFIGGDEGCEIHRLVRLHGGGWGRLQSLPLVDLLALADPNAEVDIEGLAVEEDWLWILGSHACTRAKLTKNDHDIIDLAELAAMRPMPARAVLARVPLVDDSDGYAMPVARDGDRIAGLVKQTAKGNRLAVALSRHPLLKPFVGTPAKEGGVDIEGIAVTDDRVALGLRGPTLGGFAAILETKIRQKHSGRLKLVGELSVRLLALEGLAIRDLKRDGNDLLILSGPTAAVSGPCSLWRWRDWVGDPPRDLTRVRLHRPDWIMDIPHARGNDHPEGLALFGEPERGVVILPDSPMPSRFNGTRLSIDFFALPPVA